MKRRNRCVGIGWVQLLMLESATDGNWQSMWQQWAFNSTAHLNMKRWLRQGYRFIGRSFLISRGGEGEGARPIWRLLPSLRVRVCVSVQRCGESGTWPDMICLLIFHDDGDRRRRVQTSASRPVGLWIYQLWWVVGGWPKEDFYRCIEVDIEMYWNILNGVRASGGGRWPPVGGDKEVGRKIETLEIVAMQLALPLLLLLLLLLLLFLLLLLLLGEIRSNLHTSVAPWIQ